MTLNVLRNLSVVGVEDGSFQKGLTLKTFLAVVLFKGTRIADIKVAKITVDGFDATEIFSKILMNWMFEVVMLAGISFAGFNVIDPFLIYEKFMKPVIVVTRNKPDNKAVKKALQRHFADWKLRWKPFAKLDGFNQVIILADKLPLYFNVVGASVEWAANVIHALSICGRIPEPLRVARLIARGIS